MKTNCCILHNGVLSLLAMSFAKTISRKPTGSGPTTTDNLVFSSLNRYRKISRENRLHKDSRRLKFILRSSLTFQHGRVVFYSTAYLIDSSSSR